MPLHLTPEEKWGLFLKTLIKNNQNSEINVTEVNDKEVTFTANEHTIKYLRNLLSEPELLKQKVVHAINNTKKESTSDTTSTLSIHDETIVPEYYNIPPIDLLNALLDPEYVEDGIGLIANSALQQFQYDDLTLTAKLHIEGTKNLVKRDTAKYEMLMNSLPDIKKAVQILQKNVEPINQELPEPTDLSSIFKVTINQPPTSADITYNHGLLLQMLQAEEKLSTPEKPPVIALPDVEKTIEWTLSKEVVVQYLAPIFNNIIFSQESEGNNIRPIMFSPKKAIEQPHSLHALFDTSNSMKDGFEDYLNKYLDVLSKFVKKVSDWEITIVQFNNNINSQTFNSKDHNLSNITDYVNTFQPSGTTNLHGALYQSLEHYKNFSQDKLPSTLVVFTDGKHVPTDKESPDTSIEQVIKVAQKAGENSNFALYSMGLGKEYNREFFTKIASDGGFTHINLNNTNDISQLTGYMEGCSNTRTLLEFINDTVKSTERIPQDGDIHVANNSIPPVGSVNFNGETYSIGCIGKEAPHTEGAF